MFLCFFCFLRIYTFFRWLACPPVFVNFRTPQLRLILAASLVVKLKESLRVSRATYVATFCVTEISRQDLNHYYIAFNIYIRYFLCKSCANQETETRRVSGISHASTVSPKPSFTAPGRVGDAVVGKGNAGGTKSKSGHPCSCQNCSQAPPAEKTGRDLCWIVPHVLPNDPIGQGTELN